MQWTQDTGGHTSYDCSVVYNDVRAEHAVKFIHVDNEQMRIQDSVDREAMHAIP